MLASPDQQISFIDLIPAQWRPVDAVPAWSAQRAANLCHRYDEPSDCRARGDQRRHRPLAACEHGQPSEGGIGAENLEAFADRGYFMKEIPCEEASITVTLPKPQTSGAKSGASANQDFRHVAEEDVYIISVGEKLAHHFTNGEDGLVVRHYWTNACRTCAQEEGSVHEGTAAPHQAVGARARCRCRAGASGQKSGCDAYSPRDGRASVRHAEDADGGDALSDEDAAEGGDRMALHVLAYLTNEHRRHQAAPGGDPGVRSACCCALRVTVQVAQRGPRLHQG